VPEIGKIGLTAAASASAFERDLPAMMTSNTSAERRFAGEPALSEIFAEPIVRTLMDVDGIAEQDLRQTLMAAIARKGGAD
jgi:hypothetical protein